jgi:hypothetical protein
MERNARLIFPTIVSMIIVAPTARIVGPIGGTA